MRTFILVSFFIVSVEWMSCVYAEDLLLYNSVKKKKVTSEAAMVLRDAGPQDEDCFTCSRISWVEVAKGECAATSSDKVLEVAILSTGKSIDFRHWQPEKFTLILGEERIRPCEKDYFYVVKESVARDAAVVTFIALGSQYEADAQQCSESAGTCHSSSSGGARSKRGKIAKGIDRAGMAAGLGLLASQAKGQLTGLKAKFNVTAREGQLRNGQLEAKIVNVDTHKQITINIPVEFTPTGTSGPTSTESLPSTTVDVGAI